MRRYLIVFVVFAVLFAYGFGSYAAGVGNFSNQILKQGKHMTQNNMIKNKPPKILPDLTITKIEKIKKNKPFIVNDNNQGVVIYIKNIGSKDVNQRIKVKLTYGNKSITRTFWKLPIYHTKEIKMVPIFEKGNRNYKITVTVDYNNEIKEANEDNNKLNKVFFVTNALVIKTMKAKIDESGRILYVSVKTNRPINNIDLKNIFIVADTALSGNTPKSMKMNHIDGNTTIFGPLKLSCCHNSPNSHNNLVGNIWVLSKDKKILKHLWIGFKYVIRDQHLITGGW